MAAKYEKQLSWCYVSRSSPCTINSLSVANMNRKTVNFEQQTLALLLVHLTHNLSCIKYARSIQAHRMKPSILQQMQSWFRKGKNNRSCHWLQCTCTTMTTKKKKRNSSQFITRIASLRSEREQHNLAMHLGAIAQWFSRLHAKCYALRFGAEVHSAFLRAVELQSEWRICVVADFPLDFPIVFTVSVIMTWLRYIIESCQSFQTVLRNISL